MLEWAGKKREEAKQLELYLGALLTLVLDRWSKLWALRHLPAGRRVLFLPGLDLRLSGNTGVAFSLLRGREKVLLVLLPVFLLALFLYALQQKSRPQRLFLGLVLGGGLANLWDRLLYGRVLDFLDLRFWPVFNLADAFITIGAAGYLWAVLTKR